MSAALVIFVVSVLGNNDFTVTSKAVSLHSSVTECEKIAQQIQHGLPAQQSAVCIPVRK